MLRAVAVSISELEKEGKPPPTLLCCKNPGPVMLRAVAVSRNKLKKKRVAAYPMLGAIFHSCSDQSNLLLVFSLLANGLIDIDPKLFGDNFDILTS